MLGSSLNDVSVHTGSLVFGPTSLPALLIVTTIAVYTGSLVFGPTSLPVLLIVIHDLVPVIDFLSGISNPAAEFVGKPSSVDDHTEVSVLPIGDGHPG